MSFGQIFYALIKMAIPKFMANVKVYLQVLIDGASTSWQDFYNLI